MLEKFLSRFRRNDSGNAVVEFALIVPIMATMFLGVVDAGRVIEANARLSDGVSAALRYALADAYNATDIANAALAGAGYADGEATSQYSMFCECPDGTPLSCSSQCSQGYKRIFVQVDMNRTVTTLFNYPILGGDIEVSRSGFLQVP